MPSNDLLYSRRLFLSRGVQLLSAAATLPLFLDRSARALAADFAADPQGAGRPGWLGRYFDACCGGEDPGPGAKAKAADPSAAIALIGEPPTALLGEKFIPLAFRNPAELNFAEANRSERLKSAFERLNSDVG